MRTFPSIAELLIRAARPLRGPAFDEMGIVHEALRDTKDGVLVDVGAHFGSSLRRFAEDGWRVFAFEPDPRNRAILAGRMRRRRNVTIDPRAVGERDGDVVSLYTSDVSTGISTLAPFHPTHRASEEVKTVRLDTFLSSVDRVTVLKTDTEGYDLIALRSFPWQRLHPRAVICEFEDRKTVPLGYAYHDLGAYLLERGYAVLVSEWWPVVEYGQKHRWRGIRRYPSELEDQDGWGNLIAVDEGVIEAVESAAKRPPFLSRSPN